MPHCKKNKTFIFGAEEVTVIDPKKLFMDEQCIDVLPDKFEIIGNIFSE